MLDTLYLVENSRSLSNPYIILTVTLRQFKTYTSEIQEKVVLATNLPSYFLDFVHANYRQHYFDYIFLLDLSPSLETSWFQVVIHGIVFPQRKNIKKTIVYCNIQYWKLKLLVNLQVWCTIIKVINNLEYCISIIIIIGFRNVQLFWHVFEEEAMLQDLWYKWIVLLWNILKLLHLHVMLNNIIEPL